MSNKYPHQFLESEFLLEYNNVFDLYHQKHNNNPEKTFLILLGKSETRYTYGNFYDSLMKVSYNLQSLGLCKGDRMNLVLYNCPEFLLLYFAGLRLGITLVPINPDLSPDEILYIVKDSESKILLYDSKIEFKIEKIQSRINNNVIIKKVNPLPNFDLSDSATNEINLPDRSEVGKNDEAVIIYTSGTTGNPKGVILSHLNLLADAKSISEWFRFDTNTRTLCVLPLFHNNGQVTTLLAPLFAGGSTVIVKGKASMMAFWGIIEKYGVNWTSIMSSILSILLSLPKSRTDSTLKGILCGGQILTQNVQNKFEDRFKVPIFEGYGLTETTSFSCINDYPASKRRAGSIGKPLPTNVMSILDENANPLSSDKEGEICIRGYNVACGYLGIPEKTGKSFRGDWFHSGDYGFRDNEGYFYFSGRKDSLIIKGGENIYPSELENVFYSNDIIDECAVIGIPDDILGEDLCAFVKCKSDDIQEEQLMLFLKGKIAAYKFPKKIIIINKLDNLNNIPKGPTKKILYRKLRDYYIKYLTPNSNKHA